LLAWLEDELLVWPEDWLLVGFELPFPEELAEADEPLLT
jgi:hypothetical protein